MQDDLDPQLLEDNLDDKPAVGRYQNLRYLGMGPVSETFLAQDLWQKESEVLRRLFVPEILRQNPDVIVLHLAPLAKLNHPNLVKILDIGEEEGRVYLTSEKVEGLPFAQLIQNAKAPQLLYLLGQLLQTLDYLHSQNIFHLNLKPENIHIDTRNNPWEVKLSDYGLAVLTLAKKDDSAAKPSPYIDPQFLESRIPDARYDLYSLGLLFQAARTQLPPTFTAWLQKMMHSQLKQRFSSARKAFEALQTVSEAALGKKIPGENYFSGYEEIREEEKKIDLFRKILHKGKLWAVIGEKNSGKSFLAKYLERMFWQNRKRVYRLDGRELTLLKNELFVNPFEATYILVDHAEACISWLQTHDHLNIVAFFENPSWLEGKATWTKYKLEHVASSPTQEAVQKIFQTPSLESKLLGLLARTQTWLTAAFMTEALGVTEQEIQTALQELLSQGLIERNLSLGYEVYSTEITAPSSAQEITSQEASSISKLLATRGFPSAGMNFLQSYFGKSAAKDPALLLQRAGYATRLGRFHAVGKIITAPFVKALSSDLQAKAFETLGRSLLALEKDKLAESAFRNAYKAYQAQQDLAGQARVLKLMGVLYRRAGDLSKALKFFEQALSEAEKADLALAARGECEAAIAQLYAAATDRENAELYFQKSIHSLYEAKEDFELTSAYLDYAELALSSQDLPKAQMLMNEALPRALQLASPILKARLALLREALAAQEGRMLSQSQNLHEALENLEQTDLSEDKLLVLLKRASLFEAHRETAAALRDAERVLNQAQDLQNLELQAEAHLIIAKVFRREWRQMPRALRHLQQATAKFKRAAKTQKLWECYLHEAQIENERGQSKKVFPLYQQASRALEDTLSQLGPDTEEFRQLMSEREKLSSLMQNL